MAKKNKNKKVSPAANAGGTFSPFAQALSGLLEEKYGRRIPEEFALLPQALSDPQQLVQKDKNGPVVLKSDKNYHVERVLEELLDELSPEELLTLVPKTAEESKQLRTMINQCHLAGAEDTVWRRITGYANVNREWTARLAERLRGKKCLEIMAGNGLLSSLLQDAGLSVIATDIAPDKTNDYVSMRGGNFTDVLAMDAMAAIRRFGQKTDVLICSWPPQGEEVIIKAMEAFQRLRPEGAMVYIGEWKGGFNATNEFFDRAEIIDELEEAGRCHISLPGSRDVIKMIRLRSEEVNDK